MAATRRKRGGQPLNWLSGAQLCALPRNTALVLDMGDKRATVRGRLAAVVADEVRLADGRTVLLGRIARGRVIGALFEPGELVVRRGVSEDDWRGGVIRARGIDVLVESTEGIAWMVESELERAEDRAAEARAAAALETAT